jgi:hypothetical protein
MGLRQNKEGRQSETGYGVGDGVPLGLVSGVGDGVALGVGVGDGLTSLHPARHDSSNRLHSS